VAPRRLILLSRACVLAALLGASVASAQEPAGKDQAARAFGEGVKAYAAGEYALAASRFAEAHRLSPHPNTTWNEARALLRAGERPRAANAYARYLKEAPAEAADRPEAKRVLDELASHLVRLEVSAARFDTVLVDGALLEGASTFVDPGHHTVEGHLGEQVVRKEVDGEAASVVPVELVAPAPAPASASASAPAPATAPASASAPALTPAPPPPPPDSHGWSPAVVWIGAGVTALATGATIWSGVDTLSFRSSVYDPSQTTDNYDRGVDKMRRTNFLLGLSLVSAGFTGAAAIWLVDWHGGQAAVHATVGVAPGALVVGGTFR
jgi:hypothetical protein